MKVCPDCKGLRSQVCPNCGESDRDRWIPAGKCRTCHGKGIIICKTRNGKGTVPDDI